MKKLINKLFKKLGYLPISDIIIPKYTAVEHRIQNYELVTSRVKVPNRRLGSNETYTDKLIKSMIVKDISSYIMKYVDVKVVEEYDIDPYHNTYEGKIFISRCN